jgi:hypothetical protein
VDTGIDADHAAASVVAAIGRQRQRELQLRRVPKNPLCVLHHIV